MGESRTVRMGKGVVDALERAAGLLDVTVHDLATVFCERELHTTELIERVERDTARRAALDRDESQARLAMKARPRTALYGYLGCP